jgi:spore maturation protein SpmA
MLNYVWLAILFLGIGAAVSADLIDQSQNKFQNGKPLTAYVELSQSFDKAQNKTYDCAVKIKSSDFNGFYRQNIPSDFTANGKVTTTKDGKNTLFLKIDNTMPELWQNMAKASGKEDDLTGQIYIREIKDDKNLVAQIVCEDVSFLKLREITSAALNAANNAVTIALGLIGVMALWLGVMKVADEAGLIKIIARALTPLTKRLFPDIPSDHPAMGSMIMNISANMLGLSNAATPFGLKAMEELDKLNPEKGTATNAMCTFLAINTAGMTLIPATAIAIRAAAGSSDPAIIIGTSLFGSTCATIVGVTSAKIMEKFPIRGGEFGLWLKQNAKLLGLLSGIAVFVAFIMLTGLTKYIGQLFSFVNPQLFKGIIQVVSTLAIPLLIAVFIGYGVVKKVKVYEKFVEGAKEGFNVAVRIIPYLVAMLVAIGIFRAGGAMQWLIYLLSPVTDFIGMPTEALPMALMRPLSGSGSLGIMAEIISVHGVDTFIGILTSTFFGSSETTFYVLAVYFGSVNIKKTRHALPAGLLADIAGALGALFIVKMLFG